MSSMEEVWAYREETLYPQLFGEKRSGIYVLDFDVFSSLGAEDIDPAWLQGKTRIGVTAGASAPEVLVQGVVERLRELGGGDVRELHGEPEDMVFALPKELRVTLVD